MTTKDATMRIRDLLALDRSGLPEDGGERYNRLIFEKSPYLLQHAENPVDWYPWGEGAFEAARREDKPVFLSIGYATCHWCHVMEGESFEDEGVAEVINRYFIPVKVDREERPDIDEQYMLVSQMLTGGGGWPLNVIMTPDRRPFFAATYMPKESRPGLPSIVRVLENVAELWKTQRAAVEQSCRSILEALSQGVRRRGGEAPGERQSEEAYQRLREMFDTENGGFGGAPKFPMPHYLSFLLRHAAVFSLGSAADMALQTLDAVRRGGIFDQVGFGMHRYSVDAAWQIPHFEKMLYDQALVADACWDAFRYSGDGSVLRMGEEILDFVLREMAFDHGGFCSGLDADTEGEEGKYYVWRPEQIAEILGADDAATFCRIFGVTERGNFEHQATVLHLDRSIGEAAAPLGLAPEQLGERLEEWRRSLLAEREKRPKPLRDEKVLAGWNGLMIAALARGYALTGNRAYYTAAAAAVTFIRTRLQSPEGRLMRSFHGGVAPVAGFLDDYAFMAHGVLELYQATLEDGFLQYALDLTREMVELFPEGQGVLSDVGKDAEQPLVAMRSGYDGVIPSGNSAAARNLLRLGHICSDGELVSRGAAILKGLGGDIAKSPTAHLGLIAASDYLRREDLTEVELIGRRGHPETAAMLRVLHRRLIPGLVIRLREEADAEGVRAYTCARGACREPAASAEELESLLGEIAPMG